MAQASLAEWTEFPELGLRVAKGFQVRQAAGPSLADDIQAMTLDSRGRPVVTGPGYIRTLLDEDGDGVYDDAILFAQPPAGGMGLFADGKDLWFCGGGALSIYTDADGDGRADGPPRKVLAASQGEHGGHAPRKGPDGWWYFAVGNDARVDLNSPLFAARPFPPAEAGMFLRIAPGLDSAEVFADGFRNQYDFDFDWRGDLLTFDSDVERDYPLPWYTPTRVFKVAPGGHHGWRMEGHLRSWDRPPYYPDTIPPVAQLGRGSPTGVVNYRHTQFPHEFRDGTFLADWTFGRLHFLPAAEPGRHSEPWLFLEAIGGNGFAPTDLEVTPEGDLLVSIGGRRTQGGLFRVRWADGPAPVGPVGEWGLDEVLDAPQPLAAWSRAVWEPVAAGLRRGAFEAAAGDPSTGERRAVRAVEILVEHFGGLSPACAGRISQHPSAEVRRRLAWALGWQRVGSAHTMPVPLLSDPSPAVRAEALRAWGRMVPSDTRDSSLPTPLAHGLSDPDEEVRSAALGLCRQLDVEGLRLLWVELSGRSPRAGVSWLLAAAGRGVEPAGELARRALALASDLHSNDEQLDLCRVLMLCLGDWNLRRPSVEIYTGYEGSSPLSVPLEIRRAMAEWALGRFPSGWRPLDLELGRLLAMLAFSDSRAVLGMASFLGPESDPADDFHWLVALSRLGGVWPDSVSTTVASAFLGLHTKLEGREQRQKQNWSVRLSECVAEVVRRHPEVERTMLGDSRFTHPGQAPILAGLSPGGRALAARLHWNRLQAASPGEWTVETLRLVDAHPPAGWGSALRQLARHRPLRGEALAALVRSDGVVDGDLSLIQQVVANGAPTERQWAVAAWAQLGGPSTVEDLAALVRLHRQSGSEVSARGTRRAARELLRDRLALDWPLDLDGVEAQAKLEAAFSTRHPSALHLLDGPDSATEAMRVVESITDWSGGDPARGEAIFRERACATCHGEGNAIGPDLGGIGRRLSPRDLFRAVANPDLEVAPPYRVTMFSLRDGSTVEGMVVFLSADGWMVRIANGSTIRLDSREVTQVVESPKSLMPYGLLDGASADDLRDLVAWLSR